MLYGDWGTSRFYVLGIALAYSFHASFYYVLAVGLLVAAVGWAYTIICRCYPDGGEVPLLRRAPIPQSNLAVIEVPSFSLRTTSSPPPCPLTMASATWASPKATSRTSPCSPSSASASSITSVPRKPAPSRLFHHPRHPPSLRPSSPSSSIPHVIGRVVRHTSPGRTDLASNGPSFVAVVLALSGVEAIANMTGIMVPPVTRTANKAIWPVLIEVVLLNLVLAVAMNGLPNIRLRPRRRPRRNLRQR